MDSEYALSAVGVCPTPSINMLKYVKILVIREALENLRSAADSAPIRNRIRCHVSKQSQAASECSVPRSASIE